MTVGDGDVLLQPALLALWHGAARARGRRGYGFEFRVQGLGFGDYFSASSSLLLSSLELSDTQVYEL